MYLSGFNIKEPTYWSQNYSRTSADIKICTINFLSTVIIFSAMEDTFSLWEHLLSQRSQYIANRQFKGSTVQEKSETWVSYLQKKLLLPWVIKGIFLLQAGAGMERRP